MLLFGRMKGNLKLNSSVYRISSNKLNKSIFPTFNEEKEFKKIHLNGEIIIKENLPATLKIWSDEGFYKNLYFTSYTEEITSKAINKPLTKEKVFDQITKTGNTCFEFKNLKIDIDDNVFLNIKELNNLRRNAIDGLENIVIEKFSHNLIFNENQINIKNFPKKINEKSISLLLNIFKLNFGYENLTNIDKLYIPLIYFINPKYKNYLKLITEKFNTYIYMPNIIKNNKFKFIDFEKISNEFNIKGFVISHISQIAFLKRFDLELIGNFTLNIYNNFSIDFLENLGITTFTPSIELDNSELNLVLNNSKINSEVIIYGKIPVMTNNYCFLGNSNKCYKECKQKCKTENIYYLKDRLNSDFRIIPSPILETTTIFSHKTISLNTKNIFSDSFRIDILDENLNEIQNIINNL